MDDVEQKINDIEAGGMEIPIETLINNLDKLPKLSKEQIERVLTVFPYKMRESAEKIVKLRMIQDEAKNRLTIVKAKKHLESVRLKQMKELTSESDRKCWVETQDDVIQANKSWQTAGYAVDREQNQFDYYKEYLMSAKKQVTLLEMADSGIDRSQRYIG